MCVLIFIFVVFLVVSFTHCLVLSSSSSMSGSHIHSACFSDGSGCADIYSLPPFPLSSFLLPPVLLISSAVARRRCYHRSRSRMNALLSPPPIPSFPTYHTHTQINGKIVNVMYKNMKKRTCCGHGASACMLPAHTHQTKQKSQKEHTHTQINQFNRKRHCSLHTHPS